ncbi:glutamate--tRNA ligase [Gimibacter soli]|uniref:Glutamate--tRNA ligase n=1 Tax=Gimibacter soli TaxID=3024400 RepID=A0AAE9XMJ7_9PROT|nr:glutamate--tRNA ligase [Gimibacter soli]WCL52961.1 glutamate--tRNA ligase [Gimibacter soli]
MTRFAPSPTGFLHIGGARTALYNWLFARHHGGTFRLRIEDTDRARSTDAAIEAILTGLKWLELNWDGDAVSQFASSPRHREVAEELLARGRAYRCYASAEENAAAREEARAKGENFRGDLWRDRDASEAPAGVAPAIRLKMPREGETVINDLVQGPVTVQHKELDDMILLRSDGTPTYMMAVVVDDHDMGITHVIRGDDHLNNAFRQYQLFKAMDWEIPEFAHIPLIHGPDGKKLSKRHGALGVEAYEEMGFLPEAMRNYLLRLGWSHGDEEIIPTAKAIEWFNLESVGRGPARFDFDKLDSINAHYMRAKPADELYGLVKGLLATRIGHAPSADEEARILKAMPSLAERAKRLPELAEYASLFCNGEPKEPTESALAQLTAENKALLAELSTSLKTVENWSHDQIKEAVSVFAVAKELKLGKVMQPVRAAVTGGLPSGDLVDTLEILGREETLARLERSTA